MFSSDNALYFGSIDIFGTPFSSVDIYYFIYSTTISESIIVHNENHKPKHNELTQNPICLRYNRIIIRIQLISILRLNNMAWLY